jgi:pimeloyl-ACP methyl ester carboxylesterase
MQAVLDWKNEELPSPFWHIHGTRDEVFPFRWVRPTHTIPKGDHLLMVSNPGRVNEMLTEILTQIPLSVHNPSPY